MKIIKNINAYLLDKGIKKKVLAEKANITENALNLTLSGKRRMLADEYVKICRALGEPLAKFVAFDSDDKQNSSAPPHS